MRTRRAWRSDTDTASTATEKETGAAKRIGIGLSAGIFLGAMCMLVFSLGWPPPSDGGAGGADWFERRARRGFPARVVELAAKQYPFDACGRINGAGDEFAAAGRRALENLKRVSVGGYPRSLVAAARRERAVTGVITELGF